jgi:hypothetical protein
MMMPASLVLTSDLNVRVPLPSSPPAPAASMTTSVEDSTCSGFSSRRDHQLLVGASTSSCWAVGATDLQTYRNQQAQRTGGRRVEERV